MTKVTRLFHTLLFAALISLGGCLPDYDSSSSSSDEPYTPTDPGTSNDPAEETGAPESLVGLVIVESVVGNEGEYMVGPGDSITYKFIDEDTVFGDGYNQIDTVSWSYEKTSASEATVTLNFATATSVEYLTFDTDDTNRGDYNSITTHLTGEIQKHWGTFVMSEVTEQGGGGGGGGGDEACVDNNTGELSIYSTVPDVAWINVYVDGNFEGQLTEYYPTGKPACGAPTSTDVITVTVSAGTHQISGASEHLSWPSSAFTVEQCGCSPVRYLP